MNTMTEKMTMNELDQISGGKYADYVKVSDAINRRLTELKLVNDNCTRLPIDDTVDWLIKNLGIKAEFNTFFGFDFMNGDAVYKDTNASRAGARYTQKEVLDRIAKWTPPKK